VALPSRLLVANRGEIAVRIARTCRRLGIEVVAVAAPDDRDALHTRVADAVAEISSYLDPAGLVEAARSSGSDAVHPGYGFLSESPVLAAAVVDAGLTWVGPPAPALQRAGDKLEAKRIAHEAGVPTLPTGTADEIGLPLLVKAAAGGGGRGMRVVTDPAELEDALAAAAREAEAAFGDGSVFCERYLTRPRHIEVQVLADEHGAVVTLGERDCSIQRRHQKVLEEAPAPDLADDVRDALARHARAFAAAAGYVNAGTAEFLVDGEDVWFLELNGRIQVEHPVTEEVTGVDLVELQLRIAAGERLPELPAPPGGHAIEARLYAEDPRTFLPQPGRIEVLTLPDDIRVDAGVEPGDDVSANYDPMIAKFVAHGADRAEALALLTRALDETDVAGVRTNLAFLRWLVRHPVVGAGGMSISFLADFPPLSAPPRAHPGRSFTEGWRLNAAPVPWRPAPVGAAVAGVERSGSGEVTSPMPGTVLEVRVAVGDMVEAHQPLVVVEAMKMEHVVAAPFAGAVTEVAVSAGEQVPAGAILVVVEGSTA
jgi:acetyl/propionyl-CoA carboxylase alpha subunit